MKKKSKSINYVNGKILKEYQWDDPHHHSDIIPDLQKKLSLVNTNKLNHLDLGCGNGFITKKIFHHFKTSLGVDISKNGIKLANKNFKSKKLSFSWMAAEDLYKKKKKFDFITCLEVIEHQYDPRKLMKDIENISKKGSYVLISTPFHGYLKNLALAILGKMDNHYGPLWSHGHIKFFSIKTLSELILLFKFEIIDINFSGRIYPLSKTMMFLIKRK